MTIIQIEFKIIVKIKRRTIVKWSESMKAKHSLTIRIQMVVIFAVCSILLVVLMGVICFQVLHSTMQEQAFSTLTTAVKSVNDETKLLLEQATRLLNWGEIDTVTKFLYGNGRRHTQASAIVSAFQHLYDGKMIGSDVENIYIFDTDGYGYNYRTGLFHLSEDKNTVKRWRLFA